VRDTRADSSAQIETRVRAPDPWPTQ